MGKHKHSHRKRHHDRKIGERHESSRDRSGGDNCVKTRKLDKDFESYQPSEKPSTSATPQSATAKLPVDKIDPEFPWTEYRSTLNKIFFRDKDKIQRGTSTYEDFWLFVKKYQEIQRVAVKRKQSRSTSEEIFYIEESVMQDMLMRGHLFKDDRKCRLDEERLTEFQYIIKLYFDFLEKEKLAKLSRLKEAQQNLPIAKHKEQIVACLKENQVIVIAGDTGCGKSTQVPQYLLEAGYQSIACTQPRRIACISLSKRVAYETQNEYGSDIGYQIRFEKSKTSATKILFLTEGLLLRQVSSDPMLSGYSVIILDEVHERHLPCDFLLGIMKCLAVQRPDVKIVLMSATINIELFAEYFNGCPVIQVPGRLFPIEVNYTPIPTEELKTQSGRLNPAPYLQIMSLIDHKYPKDERGDLLIFLSGMTEISIVQEAAKTYAEQTQSWIVLALHSTLSLEEQDKVFDIAPKSVRKCIISTNIAETSVTIDGVRFVADSGKVKEMSYDPNCHMRRLQEFWISRASAEQRKGRAGRTGPGVCFRLYSEREYDSMAMYSKPEIQRVSLDSLVLQMLSLGLPDARKFPFLEPPASESIEESVQSLKSQGALFDDETLTPMGQMLSRLPVEVTIGKILIHGAVFSLVDPVLSLAAALSVQSPFTNQTTRDLDIIAARQQLDSDHGDPFTLLNAYHKWLQIKSDHRTNSRQWCRKRGLEEQRFYEMTKLRNQFKDLLKDAGLLAQEDRFTSSYERSDRHGELKHLRHMKKQFHQMPRTRKILKLDTGLEGFAEADEDDKDNRIDIKDVEFRMSHNRKEVYNMSSSSQITSYRDLVCLKVIVSSGLYPFFALADIHNAFKSDSEQLFHTKSKPSAVMHPNGVFALQPDLLQLGEKDIEEIKGFRSQTSVSSRHQLIAYMTLLETTKPFLVNCIRVSAVHILLLLSHSIDTNQDFSKIVCDRWLELRFPNPAEVQEFVSKAWHIRDSWQLLLKKALEEFAMDKDKKSIEIKMMGKKLMADIISFFECRISYCMRRMLAADVKNMYIGLQEGSASNDSIAEPNDFKVNTKKGGLQIKSYLTYNCLLDLDENHLKYIQKPWKCIVCGLELMASVLDQIRHKEKCQADQTETASTSHAENADSSKLNPLKKKYFCQVCETEMYLTITEILKHVKSHT